jgi:hypothetical protein
VQRERDTHAHTHTCRDISFTCNSFHSSVSTGFGNAFGKFSKWLRSLCFWLEITEISKSSVSVLFILTLACLVLGLPL